MQLVSAVAIDGGLLAVETLDSATALALNRLVWGGLRVAILCPQQGTGNTGGCVIPALPDHVQQLTYDPHNDASLGACLHVWHDSAAAADSTLPGSGHTLPAAQDQPTPPLDGADFSGSSQPAEAPAALPPALLVVCRSHVRSAWASSLSPVDSSSHHSSSVWSVCSKEDQQTAAATPACIPAEALTVASNSGYQQLPSLACLPRQLALHQQHQHGMAGLPIQVVAYSMAPKREKELATMTAGPSGEQDSSAAVYTGGLLCLMPQQGLVFMPLDLDTPLDEQMPFQVLLHKASDELELGEDGRPRYSHRIVRLQQWLAHHPEVRVVDPLDSAAKVIDRVALCQLTGQLSTDNSPLDLVAVGAPAYTVISSVDGAGSVRAQVEASGLQPPFILKPAEACGLPHAHRMALVLGTAVLDKAARAAQLATPFIIQEFRNHGGHVAKVYVAGNKVFYGLRPSIPDIPNAWLDAWARQPVCTNDHKTVDRSTSVPSEAMSDHGLLRQGFHVFDSLKSLPTSSWPCAGRPDNRLQSEGPGQATDESSHNDAGASQQATSKVELSAVLEAVPDVLDHVAGQLRGLLGLSLFGFDVIAVPDGTVGSNAAGAGPGRPSLHVIDVNYLPNYRVPGAAEHVWAVIRDSCSPT